MPLSSLLKYYILRRKNIVSSFCSSLKFFEAYSVWMAIDKHFTRWQLLAYYLVQAWQQQVYFYLIFLQVFQVGSLFGWSHTFFSNIINIFDYINKKYPFARSLYLPCFFISIVQFTRQNEVIMVESIFLTQSAKIILKRLCKPIYQEKQREICRFKDYGECISSTWRNHKFEDQRKGRIKGSRFVFLKLIQKQPPGVFYKNGFLEDFAKFTGKHLF